MHARERAAQNCEVLRIDVHQPPVNCAPACDNAVAKCLALVKAKLTLAVRDEHVQLAKGTLVEQQVQAFARGQAAAFVLLCNFVGATALQCLCPHGAELCNFWIFSHCIR